jgi:hypothetical protein
MDNREHELRPEHRRRMRSAVSALNNLMVEIREYMPAANWYWEAGGSFYLLDGDSHAGIGERAQYQNIICSELLKHGGGGGW